MSEIELDNLINEFLVLEEPKTNESENNKFVENDFVFDTNLVGPDWNPDNLEIDVDIPDNLVFENLTIQDFDYLLQETSDCQTLFADSSISQLKTLPDAFLHVNDEKNRKRRSLLFETTTSIKPDKSENKCWGRQNKWKMQNVTKHEALLNHDYTQKRNEDKFFLCPISNCDRMYAKSSHLKAHLRRHSGEKPFACNWSNCNWKFSRSDELARHKRSHSGIKPYKCNLCEKAFARSDHLSKHNKVHRKKMAQYGTYIIKKRVVCEY